ncbi:MULTISPECIES: hypothetical protein [Methanobacterium]|nr:MULTISPECIES: hypothetical protein [Methanobacterium]
MCEDRNCGCNHHRGRHGRYHRHHMKGYKSIVKRTEKDVIVPKFF